MCLINGASFCIILSGFYSDLTYSYGLYGIPIFQIQPKLDLARFTCLNLDGVVARAGFD